MTSATSLYALFQGHGFVVATGWLLFHLLQCFRFFIQIVAGYSTVLTGCYRFSSWFECF